MKARPRGGKAWTGREDGTDGEIMPRTASANLHVCSRGATVVRWRNRLAKSRGMSHLQGSDLSLFTEADACIADHYPSFVRCRSCFCTRYFVHVLSLVLLLPCLDVATCPALHGGVREEREGEITKGMMNSFISVSVVHSIRCLTDGRGTTGQMNMTQG